MRKKVYITDEKEQRLSVLVERRGGEKDKKDDAAPKTMIVMVHDFPGDKDGNYNLFRHLEHTLYLKGLHTLRFDFMGCGASDGPPETFSLKSAYDDLNRVVAWCREEGYERFIFIGEGLGAAIACLGVDHDTRAMVLISSQVDLKGLAQKYKAHSRRPDGEKFVLFGDYKVGDTLLNQLEKQDIVPFLDSIFCPMLIMHGEKDQIAPVENLDLFRKHLSSRRIEITTFEDGDNSLQGENHRKFLFFHIMQFIEKYA